MSSDLGSFILNGPIYPKLSLGKNS